jgi:hypothetical protein
MRHRRIVKRFAGAVSMVDDPEEDLEPPMLADSGRRRVRFADA